jgi:hypothetical protein
VQSPDFAGIVGAEGIAGDIMVQKRVAKTRKAATETSIRAATAALGLFRAVILPIFLARIPCLLSLKKTPLPGQDSAAGMYWPKIKLKRTQPGRGLELSDQSSPGPTPATAEPARKPGLGLV